MRLWRIGSALFPVWSAEGARLKGGRWNRPGTPAIYAATSFASSLLETLVHLNIGRVPPAFRYVAVDVPDDVGIDRIGGEELPGWDATPAGPSVEYGDRWLLAGRKLMLLVPSAMT
ncbi:MAG: RES domain-containing protein, partial [Acetobacteraceae bacterium]|nr:RES domain-containing protein [Acetobacteraceae bacterium]